MIRALLIAFGFITFSQAAVSDTIYYCTGTELVQVKDHQAETFKPQNFKFSVNSDVIKFGKGGWFNKTVDKITYWLDETFWKVGNDTTIIQFKDGDFHSASVYSSSNLAIIITAKCDNFE